jgi:hypothetical protein
MLKHDLEMHYLEMTSGEVGVRVDGSISTFSIGVSSTTMSCSVSAMLAFCIHVSFLDRNRLFFWIPRFLTGSGYRLLMVTRIAHNFPILIPPIVHNSLDALARLYHTQPKFDTFTVNTSRHVGSETALVPRSPACICVFNSINWYCLSPRR